MANYKAILQNTQHGVCQETAEFKITLQGYPSAVNDKKARAIASKQTREWIEANCRKRLLGEGYIRKAYHWTYDLLPQRVFEVMGGQVEITLHTLF